MHPPSHTRTADAAVMGLFGERPNQWRTWVCVMVTKQQTWQYGLAGMTEWQQSHTTITWSHSELEPATTAMTPVITTTGELKQRVPQHPWLTDQRSVWPPSASKVSASSGDGGAFCAAAGEELHTRHWEALAGK